MLSQKFIPLIFAENFLGVNTKDSNENKNDGEWHEDSININSDPQGSVGMRSGFTAITTASLGTSVAWVGFYQFDVHSGGTTTNYLIGAADDGKVYQFDSGAYVELFSGMTLDANDRASFLTLNNKTLIMIDGNDPLSWTGSGSAATFATSVTADFGVSWQRYAFVHSTIDPRLVYYSDLDNPVSAYTNFLNFDYDAEQVRALARQGDDMIVGKWHHLYRVQYRGTDPLFVPYRIQANIGPVNHFVVKEIPGGRLVFLGSDFNFYMLEGDTPVEVGDNIKNYMKDGVQSRLQYAVAGLMYELDQYWCSFSRLAGATTNDRTVVMDWSRPYRDKWGKLQYPWFIYSIGANCFAEISLTGRSWLYHGGYTGQMYRNNVGTNDNGAAISNTYRGKTWSHGDPTIEKKYENIEFRAENKGDWDLIMSFVVDENAATEKVITQNMLIGIGAGALFDVAKFDEDSFATESDAYTRRDINRQGKNIYTTFGTTGLDEDWRIHEFIIHAKPLRRAFRTRES